jgi:hypothetical protein
MTLISDAMRRQLSADGVEKVIFGLANESFLGPLMPFAGGDVRDQIVSHKNDHRPGSSGRAKSRRSAMCESAWGPETDRHAKLLIHQAMEGSLLEA